MSRLSGRKEDGRSWLVEWRTGDRLWKQGSYDGCAFRATRNQQLAASGPEAGRGREMRSSRSNELFVSVSTRRSSRYERRGLTASDADVTLTQTDRVVTAQRPVRYSLYRPRANVAIPFASGRAIVYIHIQAYGQPPYEDYNSL
jgi:hypothetical protein